ncbi:MAG: hypothetical protein J6T84_10870 [Spirochaetaceae bacterium]|nr:hypothetical protein [Spirochaetaceae bacterium]
MNEFGKHPSEQLQAIFSERPFQIQEPEKARIIFLGLDANYAEDLEQDHKLFQEFLGYMKDGVHYWKTEGIHTPMLKDYYRGGGKTYHRNFKKLGFTSDNAQDICFLELLNICTYGNSTTPNGQSIFRSFLNSFENQSHLERITALANDKNKQIYLCGGKTAKLVNDLRLFNTNAKNVFAGMHFSAAVSNDYLQTVGQALKNFLVTGEYVPKNL